MKTFIVNIFIYSDFILHKKFVPSDFILHKKFDYFMWTLFFKLPINNPQCHSPKRDYWRVCIFYQSIRKIRTTRRIIPKYNFWRNDPVGRSCSSCAADWEYAILKFLVHWIDGNWAFGRKLTGVGRKFVIGRKFSAICWNWAIGQSFNAVGQKKLLGRKFSADNRKCKNCAMGRTISADGRKSATDRKLSAVGSSKFVKAITTSRSILNHFNHS